MSSFNLPAYQSQWQNPYTQNKTQAKTGDTIANQANWYSTQKPEAKKNYSGTFTAESPRVLGNTNKESLESASLKAHWGNASATNNFNMFKGILA